MTDTSRVTLRRDVAALAGLALLLAGAGTAYLVMRDTSPDRGAAAGGAVPSNAAAGTTAPSAETPSSGALTTAPGPLPDVIIRLTAEAVDRAGLVVAAVSDATTETSLRLPAIVEPNAYRQVVVTPLVAGRVTRVLAELGDRVRRGQTMAQVYSPELAETQTRYVSARAQLEAHGRELARARKLVEIGAASREELERVEAEHAAQIAGVQSARSGLELLGVAPSAIEKLAGGTPVNATADVPAPINGVVTERDANPGLNVTQATKLFTVVDLSTVWVVADLYEEDFSRVRLGSQAIVTTPAFPDLVLRGRVSYLDPIVNASTRTAKVRVELGNPGGQLRLGMFVDVRIEAAGAGRVPVVPRGAVQTVGDRHVVYLARPGEQGVFVEREVRLGAAADDGVEVVSGVGIGETVVAEGSFFLRAERERLGLRAGPPATREGRGEAQGSGRRVQEARIVVGEGGFDPASITVRSGSPVRLTFVRTTDATCGTEVVFPSENIRRALPLNQPVVVELVPDRAGELAFTCGMDMLRGSVVVQ